MTPLRSTGHSSDDQARSDPHPLIALRAQIPVPPPELEGVVSQSGVIPGTAFFPGGWGLWATDGDTALPPMPFGGIMVVGQDFNTKDGFDASLRDGYEVRVNTDGSYDASKAPTWRSMLRFFAVVGIRPESCFFTNAYMGLRAGRKNTGTFPGVRCRSYRLACQDFFVHQLSLQRPRLVIALGRQVADFLAGVAPELEPWHRARNFVQLDQNGPVRRGVRFHGHEDHCCVAVLTHPSYRHANVWRRSYKDEKDDAAEKAMVRDALRNAGLQG